MMQVTPITLTLILIVGMLMGAAFANILGGWLLHNIPSLRARLMNNLLRQDRAQGIGPGPVPIATSEGVSEERLADLREKEAERQSRQQWLNFYIAFVDDGATPEEAERKADDAVKVLERRAVFHFIG